jgi:hypothetical protein
MLVLLFTSFMDALTTVRVEWNRARQETHDILRFAHAQLTERRHGPDRYLERSFWPFKKPLLLRAGELKRINTVEIRATALTTLEAFLKSGELKPASIRSRPLLEKESAQLSDEKPV